MNSIGLEFETEEEMMEVAEKLWNKHGVTGEIEMFTTENGTYRLSIHSEKQIKDSILDKINSKRIKAKPGFGTATPKKVTDDDAN